MLASAPNPEAGRRLRMERTRVRLSTRDVERLSQKIAQEKNNQEYSVSHGWLTDIENGEFTPSIYKLYSLSVIYKRNYDEILGFFGIHIRDIGREQMYLPLPRTHLIGEAAERAGTSLVLPEELRKRLLREKTNLVSHMFKQWGGIPAALLQHMDLDRSLYGYIGMEDFTLNPLVRPGSFVEIDARQRKIEWGEWPSVFDRPIYFVELRGGYACSWCELKEKQLLLVPFPRSRSQVRQLRIPFEAEVVGRVTAVSMRITEV
jgi:transcriptional regulator with XRE-family HTH domain